MMNEFILDIEHDFERPLTDSLDKSLFLQKLSILNCMNVSTLLGLSLSR